MELIPGKRYRWTVEGVADANEGLTLPSMALRVTSMQMRAGGTVELIPDPLPTTPGSIVHFLEPRTGFVRCLVRTTASCPWMSVATPGSFYFADDEIIGATVLFDAGADRA